MKFSRFCLGLLLKMHEIFKSTIRGLEWSTSNSAVYIWVYGELTPGKTVGKKGRLITSESWQMANRSRRFFLDLVLIEASSSHPIKARQCNNRSVESKDLSENWQWVTSAWSCSQHKMWKMFKLVLQLSVFSLRHKQAYKVVFAEAPEWLRFIVNYLLN